MVLDMAALRLAEIRCQAQAQAQNHTLVPDDWEELFCDVIWDGLICWPRSPAGTLVTTGCPPNPHIQEGNYKMTTPTLSETETEMASKLCGEDGQWFVHTEYETTWTNYTQCSSLFVSESSTTEPFTVATHLTLETELYQRWVPVVKVVSRLGYGVSLVTLVAAICALALNRRLKCARNSLHLHLFTSFLLRASMALLKDHLFVQGVSLTASVVPEEGRLQFNGDWKCKVVTTVWNYSIMVNYSWILMEGLYLHNLIFQPLSADNADISTYVGLGWGLPGLFLGPWVVLRAHFEDTLCWTTHYNKNLFLFIRLPIMGSILLSFALFLNIVRVLLLKLRTFSHGRVERRQFRYSRWARSTLVLVPLFGTHYALFLGMSYYMGVNQTVEIVWLFCDQLFASFQGCCVSLLYCLLNVEVRAEIMRKWRSWRLRREPRRAGSLTSAGIGLAPLYGRQTSLNSSNTVQVSIQPPAPTLTMSTLDTTL